MATIKSGSIKDLFSMKSMSDSSFDSDSDSESDSSSESEKEESRDVVGNPKPRALTNSQSSGEIVTAVESRITLGTGMSGIGSKFTKPSFDTYENPMNDPNSRKAKFANSLLKMKNSVRSMRVNTLWGKSDDEDDHEVEMSDMDKKEKRKKRRKKKKHRKQRDDFTHENRQSRSLTKLTNSAWKGSKRYVKDTYKWSTRKRAGIYTCRLIVLLVVMGMGVMCALQYLVDGIDPFGGGVKNTGAGEEGGDGGVGGNPDWDEDGEATITYPAKY